MASGTGSGFIVCGGWVFAKPGPIVIPAAIGPGPAAVVDVGKCSRQRPSSTMPAGRPRESKIWKAPSQREGGTWASGILAMPTDFDPKMSRSSTSIKRCSLGYADKCCAYVRTPLMDGSIKVHTCRQAICVPLHVPRQRHAEALIPLRAGAGVRRRLGPVHVPAASELEIRIHRHAHGLHILQIPRTLGCGAGVCVETERNWFGSGAVVDGIDGVWTAWDSGRLSWMTPQAGSLAYRGSLGRPSGASWGRRARLCL